MTWLSSSARSKLLAPFLPRPNVTARTTLSVALRISEYKSSIRPEDATLSNRSPTASSSSRVASTKDAMDMLCSKLGMQMRL